MSQTSFACQANKALAWTVDLKDDIWNMWRKRSKEQKHKGGS